MKLTRADSRRRGFDTCSQHLQRFYDPRKYPIVFLIPSSKPTRGSEPTTSKWRMNGIAERARSTLRRTRRLSFGICRCRPRPRYSSRSPRGRTCRSTFRRKRRFLRQNKFPDSSAKPSVRPANPSHPFENPFHRFDVPGQRFLCVIPPLSRTHPGID